MNLFTDIRDERFDAYSSTKFSTYNQTTNTNLVLIGMPTKFHRYFNYQMLRNLELVDAMKFDLLDFWWRRDCRYPIVYVIAKDLLTPPINNVASKYTFNVRKQTMLEFRRQLKKDTLENSMCIKRLAIHSFLNKIGMSKLLLIRKMIFNFGI